MMFIRLLLWPLLSAICFNSALAEQSKGTFTNDRSRSSLSHAIPGMSDDELDQFVLGRSFFTIPWVEAPAATTARDGLGPLFNANSCASCHPRQGGGAAVTTDGPVDRSIVLRLSRDGNGQPDLSYGAQLSINGVQDVPFEGQLNARLNKSMHRYADGTKVELSNPDFFITQLNYAALSKHTKTTALRAPLLMGLGLIDDIPTAQITQYADIDDDNADGISGKPHWVNSLEHGEKRLGRLGWKATATNVIEQTALALHHDMGLTTSWLSAENCAPQQIKCLDYYRSSELDVPPFRLQAMAYFLGHLRTPKSAKIASSEGEKWFNKIGCNACHRVGYTTKHGVTVNPYSDFLLHDMGPQLGAGFKVGDAHVNEWRTAPLWGLGLAKILNPKAGYLHDGRASTIEQAVLWHGGEAQSSQQKFSQLSPAQRQSVIEFLNTL